jgi:hypothetical protein
MSKVNSTGTDGTVNANVNLAQRQKAEEGKTVASLSPRFWIGVASKGDFVIYYSSKHTMNGSEHYQKFTAIGIVKDNEPYQVEDGGWLQAI